MAQVTELGDIIGIWTQADIVCVPDYAEKCIVCT